MQFFFQKLLWLLGKEQGVVGQEREQATRRRLPWSHMLKVQPAVLGLGVGEERVRGIGKKDGA